MAHTRSWDSTDPADTGARGAGAQELRELKVDIKERLGIDHAYGESIDYDGEHKIITLRQQATPGTPEADTGYLYTEEISSKAELCFKDEAGNKVQLTGNGYKTMPKYGACVNLSADQSISAATDTKILLDVEDFDIGNNFANYKFTFPETGYYLVNARIQFYQTSSFSNPTYLKIYINGSYAYSVYDYFLPGYNSLSLTQILYGVPSSYLELYAYSTYASTAKYENRGTSLSIFRIG